MGGDGRRGERAAAPARSQSISSRDLVTRARRAARLRGAAAAHRVGNKAAPPSTSMPALRMPLSAPGRALGCLEPRPASASLGQPRPISRLRLPRASASLGQLRPASANLGQPRPASANQPLEPTALASHVGRVSTQAEQRVAPRLPHERPGRRAHRPRRPGRRTGRHGSRPAARGARRRGASALPREPGAARASRASARGELGCSSQRGCSPSELAARSAELAELPARRARWCDRWDWQKPRRDMLTLHSSVTQCA